LVASGDGGVRAGERVDTVVVLAVRERRELVEERVCVAAADELDEPVFCRRGDGDRTRELVAGDAHGPDDVAGEDVPFVALGGLDASCAGFLFDEDCDLVSVALTLTMLRNLSPRFRRLETHAARSS
jgi:hypothetical protein